MELYPLNNLVVNITPIDRNQFGWLRFDDNRNWIKLDGSPLSFHFALTARDDTLHEWQIEFRDQSNKPIEFKLVESSQPEIDVTNFPNLEPAHKRFFKTSISTLKKRQIFTCSVNHKNSSHDVFSFFPTLNYPEFLFNACQMYLPSISTKPFPNFVETGTLFGHTSLHASNWFEQVHSIELSDELYNELPVDWAADRGISFYHGHSSDKLPSIIANLEGPTVFFLDSHWSGDQSVNWNGSSFVGYPMNTAHLGEDDHPTADQQKPLMQELDLILTTFQEEAFLIIDDWKLIGGKDSAFTGMDWTHLSTSSIVSLLAASPRTIFHGLFEGHRYVVGLRAA